MKRHRSTQPTVQSASEARRRFLVACGKFAVATPPAISLVFAGSERGFASAVSGGGDAVTAGFGHLAAVQTGANYAARLR